MAQSALECANAALIKLGNSTISSLSDTDKAATTCNARIDVVKKALLRSHPWNFAINRTSTEAAIMEVDSIAPASSTITVVNISGVSDHNLSAGDWVFFSTPSTVVTGLSGPLRVYQDLSSSAFQVELAYATITGDTTSTQCWRSAATEWSYLLDMPSGLLRILDVTDSGGQQVEYKVESGKIATNESEVFLKYIKDVTDYTLMDSLFYECLSAYLAWDICFQLTQSNELKEQLWRDFRAHLAHAKFVDATEDSLQTFESNDWITARSETLGS